jgi:hypothetical protein
MADKSHSTSTTVETFTTHCAGFRFNIRKEAPLTNRRLLRICLSLGDAFKDVGYKPVPDGNAAEGGICLIQWNGRGSAYKTLRFSMDDGHEQWPRFNMATLLQWVDYAHCPEFVIFKYPQKLVYLKASNTAPWTKAELLTVAAAFESEGLNVIKSSMAKASDLKCRE